jgi:signal-transduction protein with cAMP-binding, CBS, and nucleotidyltransferase domain
MIDKGIHHLVVMNDKSIAGFLSSLDVLRELAIQAKG